MERVSLLSKQRDFDKEEDGFFIKNGNNADYLSELKKENILLKSDIITQKETLENYKKVIFY